MTQRKLLYIFIGVVALGLAFMLSDRTYERGVTRKVLLEPQVGERIARVKIEQRDQVIELVNRDGTWLVPARNDYPADSGKIRSLLLKLFDLTLSQKVTEDPARFATLGVDDEAVKKDSLKLTLFDAEGRDLMGVIFGGSRKGKKSNEPGVGQYVRRGDSNEVFLIGSTAGISPALTSWLNTEIVNVLPTAVRSIQQFVRSDVQEEKAFEVRSAGTAAESSSEFNLVTALPPGETLQEGITRLIGGSLQTVQLNDVLKSDDPRAQGLNFDARTVFELNDGLVYTVSSAVKEDKHFLKVNVSFDQSVADQIRAEVAAAKEKIREEEKKAKEKENEEVKPDEKGKSAGGKSEEKDDTKSDEIADPKLSTPEEAKKLDDRYRPWIYEAAKFQADKFRRKPSDLIQPKDSKPSNGAQANGADTGQSESAEEEDSSEDGE